MATSNLNPLGDLLRKARADIGMTQREVEGRTEISNAYLSQLESGKVKEPSPSVLHKLAQVYSLDYAHLLEMAGYPVPIANSKKKSAYRATGSLGPLSVEEESALQEYLRFLRSRERNR